MWICLDRTEKHNIDLEWILNLMVLVFSLNGREKCTEAMLVKHCCFWLMWTQARFTLLWQNCQQISKALTFLGPPEVLGTPEGCFIPTLLGFRCHPQSSWRFLKLLFSVGQQRWVRWSGWVLRVDLHLVGTATLRACKARVLP